MYNSHDKMEWITAKEAKNTMNPFVLPSLFNRTEPYEETIGKDVCRFTEEEARAMLSNIGYKTLSTINKDVTYLRMYVDYQIEHGLAKANPFNLTQSEMSKMLSEKKVVDRQQVLAWCNQVYNASDKVILLGLFEGIRGLDYTELTNLRKGDLNESDNTVALNGRSERLKVSQRLMTYMLDASETNRYVTYGNGSGRHTNKALLSSDLVIKEGDNTRGATTEFRKGRRIYTRLKILFRFLEVDDWMTANILTISGIIELVMEGSKKQGINWKDYIVTREARAEIRRRFNRDIEPFQFILEYEDCLG